MQFTPECMHRFCKQCTIKTFKHMIYSSHGKISAPIKCFKNDCNYSMSHNKFQEFLEVNQQTEALECYKAFVDQRAIVNDPLVVWCIRPGCGRMLKAHDRHSRKLDCRNCFTSMCFACRRVWHGDQECEDAPIKVSEELKPM